jgi:hypothetical protein
MIIEKDGRARSYRTVEEIEESIRKDIKNLTTEERRMLQLIVAEMREKERKESEILQVMRNAEYKWQPVDMRTFVYDEHYLGTTCDTIFPVLLEDLEELFSGDYHEGIWTGSIGCGKTFVATIGVCRILYEISCMKDPHKSFGLARDSNISVVAFSVTEQLARKVVFENIATKLKSSPYFDKHFPFKDTKTEMRFPHNVWVAARSSTDTSALGLNAIAAIIDEANFMYRNPNAQQGITDQAENLYNIIKRRMKSRFERQGKLPGMLFIVSSKNTTDDFTSRRIRDAKNDPSVFVRDRSLWSVRRDNYSNECFWVLCGNATIPSKIVDDPEELNRLQEDTPDEAVLVKVPVDFRSDFEKDIEGSIRDIAGVASVSVSPFLQRRDMIESAVDPTRNHPFTTEVWDPSQKDHNFVWSQMVEMSVDRRYGAYEEKKLRPIINPSAVRSIHIDPSLKGDATGICMAHIGGYKDVIRKDAEGKEFAERAPVYVVDFVMKIIPPIGDEIILGDVRQLVYALSAHGYLITYVTQDSWNSADALQALAGKGYKSGIVSMDTSPDAYDHLKSALYENRLFYYRYEPLLKELRTLEEDRTKRKRKIDHSKTGCFTGETRIPLLDGTHPTIAELEGKEVWVYSCTKEGTIVPGLARGRKTKTTTDLLDIVLDSGAVERCTPEHLWMLRDGSYKQAQLLKPNSDRLMPINRKWPVNGGYEAVTNKNGTRIMTHRMVNEHFDGPFKEGLCVHHRNQVKTDNSPDNLQRTTLAIHSSAHATLRHMEDYEWQSLLKDRDLNHKVRAVIPVTLEEPVPVYDLEVDDFSNFALTSGVFVHNSKDVSDALAGCLWTLFENQTGIPLPIMKGQAHSQGNWMKEQREIAKTSFQESSDSKDVRDYGILPPFLTSSGRDPGDWGSGGWGGFGFGED